MRDNARAHVNPHRMRVVAAELFGRYIRSGARGSTRFTFFLAQRLKALQALPITVNDEQRLYVDLRDGLSHTLLAGAPWHEPPWESDEQTLMRRLVRAGDVVFDIGAHIGLHTVLLSALAGTRGTVHAFEPNRARMSALRETIRRLPNTTLHMFGLADREGDATLFVPEDQSMSSLTDWTEGRVGTVRHTVCTLRTMDALIDAGEVPPPDFIKCDVEGAELAVFTGGARALDRKDAPIVLYEANARASRGFGQEVADSTAFLRSLPQPRFELFWIQPGATLRPIVLPGGECNHFNLIAIPGSRRNRLIDVSVVS
jgi:FkbM family methyltransferase